MTTTDCPIVRASGCANDGENAISSHDSNLSRRPETAERPEISVADAARSWQQLQQRTPSNCSTCSSAPLVSCIMPTYNRRKFIPEALQCFFSQDYPNLELIIVDDGSDLVDDLIPRDPRITYIPLSRRATVGAKRNMACARARGQFVVHLDDDDVSVPWRISVQIAALQEADADVCGSSVIYFVDHRTSRAYKHNMIAGREWAITFPGTTLAYRRDNWTRSRFLDSQEEDQWFIQMFAEHRRIDLLDPSLVVATLHPENTTTYQPCVPRPLSPPPPQWSPESYEGILDEMRAAALRPRSATKRRFHLYDCPNVGEEHIRMLLNVRERAKLRFAPPADDVGLELTGAAMEPTFAAGDVILVGTQVKREPRDGEMLAVKFEGRGTAVGRFRRGQSGCWLERDSPAYPTLPMVAGHSVVGFVVGFTTKEERKTLAEVA